MIRYLYLVRLSLILALILSLLLSPKPALSQEENAPTVSEEEIKANIRERLEAVVAGAEDENEAAATPQATASTKRAWVGQIVGVAAGTLSIKVRQETKQVRITEATTIVDENRATIEADDLEIDTFVIVMGYLMEGHVLDARRIVESEEPTPNRLQAYLVTLTNMKADTLTVKNNADEESWELALLTSTAITQSVDGEITDIERTDLQVDDQLVIIAEENSETPTALDTTNIHLVNGRTIPAVENDAATSSSL